MVNPDNQVKQARKADARRALPAVDRLARAVAERRPDLPAWTATEAARQVVEEARPALAAGDPPAPEGPELWEALAERAAERAARLARPRPRRVVNATGVVLHTNLGRAVLAPGAARAAFEAATAYSDLELATESGRRGDRQASVAALLTRLGGCEAAFAVNNNAAAVLLAVDTLARGREVVVSRGELVEIGGSFRVPEILARAGVRLVEVGTTNRTHPEDYRRAIGPDTALLLKVHRSNFELRGFTAEVDLPELVAIGREHGVPVVEDLGSGSFLGPGAHGLPAVCHVPARMAAGPDCLCFSGDKLLGGPQAGIVLGRRSVVEAMRRNPLSRALRLDKLSLAALDWTLRALLEGREAEIPTVRQLAEPLERTRERARALAERLRKVAGGALSVEVASDRAAVGGGALPELELETCVVALRAAGHGAFDGPEALAAALRAAPVPVVGRIREDAVLLDARTLLDGDEALVEHALREALAPGVV